MGPPHLDVVFVGDIGGSLQLGLEELVLPLVVTVIGDGRAGNCRVGDPAKKELSHYNHYLTIKFHMTHQIKSKARMKAGKIVVSFCIV